MGIGDRFGRLFGAGRAPAEGEPGSMREAGLVLLADGPRLVERLRDQGIEAIGLESVDPVSGVRSNMRIMVRQADLAAARYALEERDDPAWAGEALDDLAAVDTDADSDEAAAAAAAEEESQQVMSRLFLAADRLAGRPGDVALVAEVERLSAAVAGGPPPFGVEPLAWQRVASMSAAVVNADESGDEDEVRVAAQVLRDFLREYV